MKKTLLMLAATAPLLVACGAGSVSESDVESKTKTQLAADKVDCPDDLKAEKGETMSCTATVGGQEIKVKLTVTSVEDNTAEWTVDIDE